MWGYGFDMYDEYPARAGWKQKSAAATGREEAARAAFTKLLREREDAGVANAESIELLTPNQHLTQPCWATFRKWVKTHPGWTATRRVATPEEKAQFKEKRKADVYFTTVHYSPDGAGGSGGGVLREKRMNATSDDGNTNTTAKAKKQRA